MGMELTHNNNKKSPKAIDLFQIVRAVRPHLRPCIDVNQEYISISLITAATPLTEALSWRLLFARVNIGGEHLKTDGDDVLKENSVCRKTNHTPCNCRELKPV